MTDLMTLVLYARTIHNALEQIKDLVKNNPSKLDMRGGLGLTALIVACRECNGSSSLECVILLIELGAKVNYESGSGTSALMEACRRSATTSSLECVKLLIGAGSNVNFAGTGRDSILISTVKACGISSSVECIQLLINSGVDVNVVNRCWQSASLLACEISTKSLAIECLHALICAEPKLYLSTKETALELVCKYCTDILADKCIACIDYLVRENTDRQTALMALCKDCDFNTQNVGVLIDLINLTRDLSAKDRRNKTAFDYYMRNRTHYNDIHIKNLLTGNASAPIKSARKI